MSIYKELSYDQHIDVVRGIQFGVLGPEEIERRSVVEVKKTDTYSGNDPVVDGLFDPRMGVLEHSRVCATVSRKTISAPVTLVTSSSPGRSTMPCSSIM